MPISGYYIQYSSWESDLRGNGDPVQASINNKRYKMKAWYTLKFNLSNIMKAMSLQLTDSVSIYPFSRNIPDISEFPENFICPATTNILVHVNYKY